MSALQGKMLGGYRLLERIGRGDMGDVYRAQHLRLGREAAIKVLHTDLAGVPDFLRRFEREAPSVARLDHPSILPIWEFGEQDGRPNNDPFIARLDVSAKTAAGDVRIGTGFYTGSQITGRWTAFEGFTISRPR